VCLRVSDPKQADALKRELDRRVRRFYRQFGSARVRTLVAILVERRVRRSIDALPPLTPGAVAPDSRSQARN
jgi:hypothetical protein